MPDRKGDIEMAKKKTGKKTAVKKAAVKKTKKTSAKKPPGKKDPQKLDPKPGQVIIRVYRQGLGDCYLLAFGGDTIRFVLIDCGIHMRQTDGNLRLMQVMKNLTEVTSNSKSPDGHLDVVVATHEHADHLSGFVQKNSPFLNEDLEIDTVWLAWTEDRQDATANDLRKKHAISRDILKKAIKQAQDKANKDPALKLLEILAERAKDQVSFEQIPANDVDPNLRKVVHALMESQPDKAAILDPMLKQRQHAPQAMLGAASDKKQPQPTSNELALGLLMMKGEPKFFRPGDVAEIPGVDEVRAYVLGPPRKDLELLKKDKPSKIRGSNHEYKETYLSGLQSGQAFALSPALHPEGSASFKDLQYPFAKKFFQELNALKNHSELGHYQNSNDPWRRIDGDWLNTTEELALHLDSDTNNTSLVLAFELGKPGEGPVLLFPGDAQVGNWLSWRDQEYQFDGKTSTADDLMARTLFYKVGHHGSHNATVKRDPRKPSPTNDLGEPFGLELMKNIIAAIPVDRDAADKNMPTPWAMPHLPLYERLREKAHRRVLRG